MDPFGLKHFVLGTITNWTGRFQYSTQEEGWRAAEIVYYELTYPLEELISKLDFKVKAKMEQTAFTKEPCSNRMLCPLLRAFLPYCYSQFSTCT